MNGVLYSGMNIEDGEMNTPTNQIETYSPRSGKKEQRCDPNAEAEGSNPSGGASPKYVKTFTSRYGDVRTVEQIDETTYRIFGGSHFLRTGSELGEISFVDFEGGPMIEVNDDNFIDGRVISGLKIEEIPCGSKLRSIIIETVKDGV